MKQNNNRVVLSVVSHGQLKLIDALFSDLCGGLPSNFQVVLTINIPEDESVLSAYAGFPLTIIRNHAPKGFGENHNAAFRHVGSDIFVIVNPDIRIPAIDWDKLFDVFDDASVGACAPLVVAPNGHVEDSVRHFPTLVRLAARVLLRRRKPIEVSTSSVVDWVAGMFVAYRSTAYAHIGGFDERYFMYMEDADICRRLGRKGWKTIVKAEVSVVHAAQRASRRNFRHLKWHVGSAFRFLFLTKIDALLSWGNA
jgi:GT2 family glycosyltransferase